MDEMVDWRGGEGVVEGVEGRCLGWKEYGGEEVVGEVGRGLVGEG